jgi:hypothetical protein
MKIYKIAFSSYFQYDIIIINRVIFLNINFRNFSDEIEKQVDSKILPTELQFYNIFI